MLKFFVAIIAIITVTSTSALACQPCRSQMSIEETAKAADLIIIGHKIERPENWNESQYIEIQVDKIVKGSENNKLLKVRSFYGMCAYGIQLEKGESAVIFLSKDSNEGYVAVSGGCAQKTILIKNGIVNLDEQFISVDSFIEKYIKGK